MVKVAPSILSGDFAALGADVKMLHDCGADWIHIDVMDGNFVPNITIGMPVVKALRPYTDRPFDVHLMIDHPGDFVEEFAAAGADYLTVHYENNIHLHRLLQQIKAAGMKAGVSIVPSTPVCMLESILPSCDLVLVMTVNPGFGGQKFIDDCLDKVSALSKMREEKGLDFIIEIDGGVTEDNCAELAKRGADVLVAGSAVFKAADRAKAIRTLQLAGE